jgi:hypothetical protein
VIVTPIETLLTPGIRVRIDDSEPVGIPYTLCEPTGCLARIPLTPENVDAFQAGGEATLEIFALVRSELGEIGGVPVPLTASLRGFTAAYNALQDRHTAFAELLAEAQAAAEGEADRANRIAMAVPPAIGRAVPRRSVPRHTAARSTRTAFSPPKAKALDRTASTFASRASFGTTSSAHSGSGSS